MNKDSYIQDLKRVAKVIEPHATTTTLRQSGVSSFLSAEKGKFGVELYRDEDGKVVVDPSINDELQGELEYANYEDALVAVLHWLENGKIE